ncbi:MAG: TaqI-like C-terminal specificity domain-containing protein [Rubrobacteraceae bacterium]
MTRQETLPMFDFSDAVGSFARSAAEERGAIFTRREVVEFILDLSGYTVERPLHNLRLLEPSFGNGDFLLPVVERLLNAYAAHSSERFHVVEDLANAIRAVEVHPGSIESTCAKLFDLLCGHGVSREEADELLQAWIVEGDFLLTELPGSFTHAVGNPPYVRHELIPAALMVEYRARYGTIYDRADLYVPFFERSLTHLEPGGTLGFICSDRWMKNKYGGPLRAMVAGHYHLTSYVDMVDTDAFHSEVIAYPAITTIKRERPGPTRISHRPAVDSESLAKLARAMRADTVAEGSGVVEVANVASGSEPWILQSLDQLAVVRRLEAEFPIIEDTGCRVGIGVATGADKVFIGPFDSLDVEPDRKLPLATTRDIESGIVEWRGLGVINPFRDDGSLVALVDYPKLARYLERNSETVRNRNCAKRNPKCWYRTIDRIHPDLAGKPKLLIPDIKGEAHIVYEDGQLYPHHNLYFITSAEWDLKALQAVLRSGIAKLFVSTYSTRMRGGYLRFQAQYLRRIRLPRWKDVPEPVREALVDATSSKDLEACNRAVTALYRLTAEERAAMGDSGKQDDR